MNRLLAGFLVFAALGAGCAELSGYRYWNSYSMTAPAVSPNKTYADDLINVRFWFDEKKIHFTLINLTDGPMVIDWKKGAYRGLDGNEEPVANSATLFSEKRLLAEPTVIKSGEAITDFVAPLSNVENLEEWTYSLSPLFDMTSDAALGNKGKTFGIDMPVKVGDTTKTYAFMFKISLVQPFIRKTR